MIHSADAASDPDLLDLPLFRPLGAERRGRLETAFWRFHVAHPRVFETLVALARQWQAEGHGRISIKMLYERARWEFGLGSGTAKFRLNNNHTAFFARLMMTEHPDLRGIFRTRRQKRKATTLSTP